MGLKRRTRADRHWRGTGGTRPHFSLSNKTKNTLLDLFKRNTLEDPDEFIRKIENSIQDCLYFAKCDEEYPPDQLKYEFQKLAKHSSQLVACMQSSNIQVLNYINQVNYQNCKEFLFTDEFINSLDKLESISNSLARLNKRKHSYIHGLTSAIASVIKAHSNCRIYDGPACKLLQIMTSVLPEVEKSLSEILITDTIEPFKARRLVQHYLKNNPQS